jgi:hypothetical protein
MCAVGGLVPRLRYTIYRWDSYFQGLATAEAASISNQSGTSALFNFLHRQAFISGSVDSIIITSPSKEI